MKTVIALILGVALAGCTLFDDRPDDSCKTNNDCFQAQGEVCNPTTKTCEVEPDAGP